MALTIAVHDDRDILQLDVPTAFLDANVQEQVLLKTLPTTGQPTSLPDYLTS